MFNGIEVDVLSLGDADSILVTQWVGFIPHRVLVDGGLAVHGGIVKEFLHSRNCTNLSAVLCTHLHNDHARGLIKVVQDRSITIHAGWMHDIRRHLGADALRRASSADDNAKEVVENTKELASAFAGRGIVPKEPFAGGRIAYLPDMTLLGPSFGFYNSILREFTKVEPPAVGGLPRILSGLGPSYGGPPFGHPRVAPLPPPRYTTLSSLLPPPSSLAQAYTSLLSPIPRAPSPTGPAIPLPPLTGALSRSSVKTNPITQPFNNTCTILGVTFGGNRILLTGDAGSEALVNVPAEWNHLLYLGVPHHGSEGNLSQIDIERFCPQFAVISACGDSSHPSRAIVSGLVKVGAKVYSTHKSGNLCFWSGSVPQRPDYGPVEPLEGTGNPEPVIDWAKLLLGTR